MLLRRLISQTRVLDVHHITSRIPHNAARSGALALEPCAYMYTYIELEFSRAHIHLLHVHPAIELAAAECRHTPFDNLYLHIVPHEQI